MSIWSLTYQQSVLKQYHSDKHFSEFWYLLISKTTNNKRKTLKSKKKKNTKKNEPYTEVDNYKKMK